MKEIRAELEQKYRQAVYVVNAENGLIRFHVGEFSPKLDALLIVHKAETFAFITAYNPRSKKLSNLENKLRHVELKNLLIAGNFRFIEGYGSDEDEKWGREISLFVMNISEEEIRVIAKKFDQNAIVCGAVNEKSLLVWIN